MTAPAANVRLTSGVYAWAAAWNSRRGALNSGAALPAVGRDSLTPSGTRHCRWSWLPSAAATSKTPEFGWPGCLMGDESGAPPDLYVTPPLGRKPAEGRILEHRLRLDVDGAAGWRDAAESDVRRPAV